MWRCYFLLLLIAGTVPLLKAERHLLISKYLADDGGMVCERKDMDYGTGCCKTGEQHTCQRCPLQDNCCAEYEHCVSCCLAPSNNAAEKSKKAPRIRGHPETGTWDNPFDYCQAICRTHARSTSHENSYIGTRHHCFSELGRPQSSDPLPPGALDNVAVVLGNRGESCTAACSRQGKECSADHMKFLNSCDRLREHAGCEAGCEASPDAGYQPAYVDAGSPKNARPAMCFTSATPQGCAGQEGNVRRLCPCTAAAQAAAGRRVLRL